MADVITEDCLKMSLHGRNKFALLWISRGGDANRTG
jgi:hypothetical protein